MERRGGKGKKCVKKKNRKKKYEEMRGKRMKEEGKRTRENK